MTQDETAASPSTNERGSENVPMAIGIFLISVAVLALQVLQTRILSVQMWHHHSYMVVTMTLLGFGAAGSLVTVCPSLARTRVAAKLAWSSTLFAVSTILGYLILSKTADRAADMTASGSYLSLSLFYSYLLIPYFFAGLVVTIVLTAGRNVHRLYFVNLMGSALGAWVFIAVITPLGAERLLVLCAATGPLAALGFLRKPKAVAANMETSSNGGRGLALAGAVASLIGCAVLFASADRWLDVKVASTKAQPAIGEKIPGAKLVDQVWTPLCRLDFIELPGKEEGEKGYMNVYQDGDAITIMHSDDSWEDVAKVSINTMAYLPHLSRGVEVEALAIGIGGGIDLRYALANNAKSILGIEINSTTVDKVGKQFVDFNGDVYHKPGVTVEVGEGRSTLRRLDQKFDLIQLSGTDTYTAGNSGAYVLSESYLYTSEAVGEYLDHLKPGGTLGMIRLAYDPPRENLRLFAIALEELRKRGVENPSQNVVVVFRENYVEDFDQVIRFSGVVVSVDPLGEADLATYKSIDGLRKHRLVYYPGMEGENEFSQLAAAIEAGTEQEFYDNYYYDVRPVSDDAPFFFNFYHWGDVLGTTVKTEGWHDLTGGPVGLKVLGSLLLQTSLLTAFLVILPLLVLRTGGLKTRYAGRTLCYFIALGAGFMFLEISTIQRLVLFLGHPTYSLTVTLFCFLFFAGLGALYARRFSANPARALRIVVFLMAIGIGLMALFLEDVLHWGLAFPLPARVAMAAALLAPLNFLMGMPFPIGLDRLKRIEPRLVPWALGANGSASVVGSILCIIIAMSSGFRTVSLFSLAIYVGGMLLFTTGSLSPAKENA